MEIFTIYLHRLWASVQCDMDSRNAFPPLSFGHGLVPPCAARQEWWERFAGIGILGLWTTDLSVNSRSYV